MKLPRVREGKTEDDERTVAMRKMRIREKGVLEGSVYDPIHPANTVGIWVLPDVVHVRVQFSFDKF